MELELEAWRILCRTVDMGAALSRVLPHLRRHLGCRAVVVRRILQGEIQTVASAGEGVSSLPARSPLRAADHRAVLAWAGAGSLLHHGNVEHEDLLALLAPEGMSPVVAGPLTGQGALLGAVLFRVDEPGAAAWDRLSRLLDPFAAALETDHRIRLLHRRHQAVEADREALLSRLQRSDISEAVVGSETGLVEVIRRVEQVAMADVPVLLLGETGSGKEVIARTLHDRSPRAPGPMLKVNCGAIPEGLVDSELFGHERGSFTGAEARRKGWFERADGGTLFLDEVGELPLAAQVRLLRILQDGTLVRVGAESASQVDVRVVAATHSDLKAMVSEGRFREDLWYRLGVFPIVVPPLRERIEDIPALAQHFAWRAGRRLGGSPLNPSAGDIKLLLAYPWPGNVRELAAVIERAAILGDGVRLEVAAALGTAPPPASPPSSLEPSLETLDQAATRTMERALRATGGVIEGPRGAARILGVNPHTLRSRMRRLGLRWEDFRQG